MIICEENLYLKLANVKNGIYYNGDLPLRLAAIKYKDLPCKNKYYS